MDISREKIESHIFYLRNTKVMLDRDLANLYQVETRQLKRQVRRNIDRFPEDFMFVLNEQEINEVVCQNGTPSRSYFGGAIPYAFTEHGILMLSSVLNSKRAIIVNIQIMRTFSGLRRMLSNYSELHKKLLEIEKRFDSQFKIVFDAIKALMKPTEKTGKKIGFLRGGEKDV
ncbi:MAG: ORF6N domain-containing protein [Candidatus Margulisbacteria bacterium]|nr:ORF6N domain-containing protein [Candidatus Margulisiibacteriota bacterium]